jgi:hypothetical protein
VIDYLSEGEEYRLTYPLELVLCEGNGGAPEWIEECSLWDYLERYQQAG